MALVISITLWSYSDKSLQVLKSHHFTN